VKHRLALAWVLVWLSATPILAVTAAPEAGMLLVARPELPDPRFREAVILLVQHGPGGAAGLILNRPSRMLLSEVLPNLPQAAGASKTLAYGGPVAPRAFMVLVTVQGEPPEPSRKVVGNVYLTGPEQLLAWLEKTGKIDSYRVFAGYGGWAPGQLAAEMTRGDWQVLPADEASLFSPEVSGLWRQLVRPDPVPGQ
jgi:putative transcriptional regulator